MANDQGEFSDTHLDSISEEMEKVHTAASTLLNKAGEAPTLADMASAVEKAAGALKQAAEMRKTQTEVARSNEEITKLRYENLAAPKRVRAERIRDYISFLTPAGTIIVLAATLIAQNWQFLRSERAKREDALDVQWQNGVKMISESGALSPGVVALQPFLRSPKYGDQARDVAVNLLSNSSDSAFFASLFGTALTPVTWENVERQVRLNRALTARIAPLSRKSWDPEKKINDDSRLTENELATQNYAFAALEQITSQIGSLLKAQRSPNTHIDLSGTAIRNGDWKNVNLDGANLENAWFVWTDLEDAQLEGVTQFNGIYVYRTTWWKVKSINRPLLDYLETSYPFESGQPHGPRSEIPTQESYDAAIRRLRSQSK
jgi:hypothetical protein